MNKQTTGLLVAGFFMLIVMVILVQAGAIQVVNSMADLTKKLHQHPFTVSNKVLEANSDIIAMHRYMKDVALAKNTKDLKVAIALVNSHEAQVYKHFDLIKTRFLGDKARIEKVYLLFSNWKPIRSEVIELMRKGKSEEAALITKDKGARYVETLTKEMAGLIKFARNKANEFVINSNIQQEKSRLILYGLMSVIIVIGLLIAYFVIRKVSESSKKLRDSEQRWQFALKGSRYGVWDWNIKSGDLYWSEGVAPLFGYLNGGLESKYENFIAAIFPDDREMVLLAINDCIKNGIDYNIEHRVIWPDGQIRWVQETGDVVRDDKDVAVQMIGVIQDIHLRKVQQQRLKIAKDEAEKANKAKSEFLSSMSHELRTPLNAVIGFSQLLMYDENEPLTPDQRDCTERIVQGGEHLLKLINDVLDLAKIESGNIDFLFESISIKRLVSDVLALVQPIITKYQVNMDSFCQCEGPDDIMIYTDFLRTKQVLLNLISNAAKYNKKNGHIQIQCNIILNKMLRITVIDEGNGISKEKQTQLFKPFSRLGAENSDIEGAGIGLVVCKELIEKMNGEIGFESEMGKGSSFWVELPLSIHITEEKNNINNKQELPLSKQEATILYIEDNPANLKLMETLILRTKGLKILTTTTAEEGLNIAQDKQPDIIILDINLPGMSGIEAIKHLKNNVKTRDIPVFALSAAATVDDISRSKDIGFEEYITKPIDINNILNSIYDVLRKKT